MFSRSVDPCVLFDPGWWHWLVTVLLLAAHLLGVPLALAAAVALCLVMAAWYYAHVHAIKGMAVQIRLAFAGLLLIGLLPGMWWIHWVQVTGTSALVVLGYCLLERLLTFFPWNRQEPLTLAFIGDLIFRERTRGGILAVQPGPMNAASCSIAGECSELGERF